MAKKVIVLVIMLLAVCLAGSNALAGKGGIPTYQYAFKVGEYAEDNGQWGMVTLIGKGCDADCGGFYKYMLVVTAKNLEPGGEYYVRFAGGDPVAGPIFANNGGNLTVSFEACCNEIKGVNIDPAIGPAVLWTYGLDPKPYCEICED